MKTHWLGEFVAVSMASLMFDSTSCYAQDIDKQVKALHEIEAAVPIFCTTVPIEGENSSLQLDGKGEAELSRLLKSLADLKLEGGAKYSTETYKGVYQRDLPKAIHDSDTCKVHVLEILQKMISEATSGVSCPPGAAVCIAPKEGAAVDGVHFNHSKLCGNPGLVVAGEGLSKNVSADDSQVGKCE